MDPARWEQVQSLFHEALDLRGMDQHAFLEAACAGDRRLMADVLAMLESLRDKGALSDLDSLESYGYPWIFWLLRTGSACPRARQVVTTGPVSRYLHLWG